MGDSQPQISMLSATPKTFFFESGVHQAKSKTPVAPLTLFSTRASDKTINRTSTAAHHDTDMNPVTATPTLGVAIHDHFFF